MQKFYVIVVVAYFCYGTAIVSGKAIDSMEHICCDINEICGDDTPSCALPILQQASPINSTTEYPNVFAGSLAAEGEYVDEVGDADDSGDCDDSSDDSNDAYQERNDDEDGYEDE